LAVRKLLHARLDGRCDCGGRRARRDGRIVRRRRSGVRSHHLLRGLLCLGGALPSFDVLNSDTTMFRPVGRNIGIRNVTGIAQRRCASNLMPCASLAATAPIAGSIFGTRAVAAVPGNRFLYQDLADRAVCRCLGQCRSSKSEKEERGESGKERAHKLKCTTDSARWQPERYGSVSRCTP